MRVGEILLRERWLDWEPLVIALDDQRGTDVRIVSLLVARRHITFDQGSRALAELHGVRALLQRHLEARDHGVVATLPAELMRTAIALPIGRMGDGTLIVAVRDPSAALEARIAQALAGAPFALAVAPASELERALAEALERRAADEVDISVDAGAPGEVEVDLDASSSGELALDIEVATTPVRASKPLPVAIKPVAAPQRAGAPDSIEAVIAALPDIDDVGWLLDAVTKVLAKHWVAAIVRPAGEATPGSLIALACERRRVVYDVAPRPADSALVAELRYPAQPVVAPVLRGDQVAYIIAVGAPREGEVEDAAAELAMLAEAVGERLASLDL